MGKTSRPRLGICPAALLTRRYIDAVPGGYRRELRGIRLSVRFRDLLEKALVRAARCEEVQDRAGGRDVAAARLWGDAQAMLEEIEVISYPYASDRALHQRRVAEARVRLDEAAWGAAWADGRRMTTEQAVEYALEGEGAAADLPKPVG